MMNNPRPKVASEIWSVIWPQDHSPFVSARERVFNQWEDVRGDTTWVGRLTESSHKAPKQGIEVYIKTLTPRQRYVNKRTPNMIRPAC